MQTTIVIPKRILPIIVIAQFLCTSLWFAGNGVMADLIQNFGLRSSALGHLTSVVQFGFIAGTLIFAVLCIADRYAPSKVFFVCALLGAICNVGLSWQQNSFYSILFFRFLTGFFLAGIYPVGMKIAADYYQAKLGKSLGFLVGALVLGTALPHLVKSSLDTMPWESVIYSTSALAFFGGLLMLLWIPNGPYRTQSQEFSFTSFFTVFKTAQFRSAAFGYFGHMWELYAFWTFVPVMISSYLSAHVQEQISASLSAFFVIGIGSLACVTSGLLCIKFGEKRTARWNLLASGICCLLAPWIFAQDSLLVFLGFLLFWGFVVIGDSPMFSTLVAKNAPAAIKGTALTIVNCIGFAITIVSIELLGIVLEQYGDGSYLLLAAGPFFGLWAMRNKKQD